MQGLLAAAQPERYHDRPSPQIEFPPGKLTFALIGLIFPRSLQHDRLRAIAADSRAVAQQCVGDRFQPHFHVGTW